MFGGNSPNAQAGSSACCLEQILHVPCQHPMWSEGQCECIQRKALCLSRAPGWQGRPEMAWGMEAQQLLLCSLPSGPSHLGRESPISILVTPISLPVPSSSPSEIQQSLTHPFGSKMGSPEVGWKVSTQSPTVSHDSSHTYKVLYR